MSKIRVAFFAEILIDDFDGASRTMYHIINLIPKDQFQYHFFCGVPPDKEFDFPVTTVPTITAPFNRTYKIATTFGSRSKLEEVLAALNPQVIHIATPSLLGEFALSYARKHRIPVISIYHTHFISYFQFYFGRFKWLVPSVEWYVKKRMVAFYNKCHVIYVPTDVMIDELGSYGIKRENMRLWPRGLDHDLFNPIKKDLHFRQRIAPDGKPIILYASRLVWEKNVQTLIDIYQLTHEKYHFVIVGDGVAKEDMEKNMTEATFLGTLDHEELAVIYASSDVFIFPSITETYGNVVIEAMASGLPCIVANGGGSTSFIDHGTRGFLAEPLDANDFAHKIEMIVSNPTLQQTFIREGIAFTNQLRWPTLISQYFDDITSLANQIP